ncbi:receptor-like serine/threonine-protein kinase ALE2 [Neltuma alba]|uniref:receptor-like serine/threonine-protein kinase ALE2 n=1 Tax=Neltuma alba TaxID=207710 RepID=UPI0010A387EC|nr:receptor-like serine/threonine-protein kinase ALE2 [Prosopis alba]
MGLFPLSILLLVKLCIISYALGLEGSRDFAVSPSPATMPVHSSPKKSRGPIAPNTPAVPNGPLLHHSVTLSPPTTQLPKKTTGAEPSASPSASATMSPPPSFEVVPPPSTEPSASASTSATMSPPPSFKVVPRPSTEPSASPSKNATILPPASSNVDPPPSTEPPPSPSTGAAISPRPPYSVVPPPLTQPSAPPSATGLPPSSHKVVPPPSTSQGLVPPPVRPSPPQRIEPALTPPVSTPDVPAPIAPPSVDMPKHSPVGLPVEPDFPHKRNANESHHVEPVSPAATPPINLPKISPGRPPTEDGSFPPIIHKSDAKKGHAPEAALPARAVPPAKLPNSSPISQPTGHGGLPPNIHSRNTTSLVPPASLPQISPVSRPTTHGSLPPKVHERIPNKGRTPGPVSPGSVASSPRKVQHNPPLVHPISPSLTPPILPAPVASPSSALPVNPPPSVHPVKPVLSPSELPAPVVSPSSTPSRIINWKKGGAPVAAPLYRRSKPLPALTHSPAQAPAAREHHHKNIVTSPAPASSDLVSPPTSVNQGQAMPPSLLPTSGRRHYAPPPANPATTFSFPTMPPRSQVSHAPSPLFKFGPHPAKIPFLSPESPPGSSSKRPKTPVQPKVQALPPPPPNEDCLSTVCTEPYTNSPPGAPCRCVWPMQVGLRLGVSLYTFFPLVSELASEISTGVFMKQSQVRIMGAKSADQQPDETDVLIDLVPLGEIFDNNTAFLTSQRFWHKKVAIKASYFGDYEVLYVSYPGLPPSPPLPPSMTMIDGGPYSNGNNGRAIKPIGVDIPKRQHRNRLSGGVIAIISLSAFVAVLLCSAAAWVLLFKRRDHVSQTASTPRTLPPSLSKTPGTVGSVTGGGPVSASSSFRSSIAAYKGSAKNFSMSDIERATNKFHTSRILGEGGFGRVYSGTLDDGTKVAVKVLKREDHHGDREFLAEVEMLSRLHHRNLVKLIGICTEETFRCLVYELIPNGSVDSHLHGVDRETSPIDWVARMKIALGAARGLAYLHEDSSPRVIHRDFKSSNILLEDDFTPKVSDFGLARIATDEENRHISTRVMGTFGYVAPEYAMTGHLLVKSDVYSYGVVLLELLTGRKPVDMSQPPGQENLVAWARPLLTSKEGLESIIDPSLGPDVPFDSVAKVAAIASMCVQPEVSNRPFMGEVVQALKLVCNECDEAREAFSRSSSKDDLSVDLDMGVSTTSGQQADNFQGPHFATSMDRGVDIERGLSASELFSSSARFGRQESGSFRRHSYSGPLMTGRSRRLWHMFRRLSGGSVSEHRIMYKL